MNLANNRKAYFEYQIIEEFDAGIILLGTEVKSIRLGGVNLTDSYIFFNNGELWIKNLKVSRYKQQHFADTHDENRQKKLLLTKAQILKISKLFSDNGVTCVPLQIFIKNNKIKLKIGVVKGKKLWDKRQTIKERDLKRESQRGI